MPPLNAISALEEAEKLLWEDKPELARPLLEDALNSDPKNEKVYNYLGIVYQQLGDNKKAIMLMQRGLDIATDTKPVLYCNIGNNFYTLGEKIFAEENYSKAIALNSYYAEPYLNRANARVELKKYQDAINDYERYLILMPNTLKRPEIEAMIAMLMGAIQDHDRKKAEELAKEKALMDEIMNSLKNASEDTKNLSVDSEVILEEKVGDVDIDE
jgi:tetratricopeptide (TPR) repeat protein